MTISELFEENPRVSQWGSVNQANQGLGIFEERPEETLKRGEVLFSQPDSHIYIYLVTKGMVKLYSFSEGRSLLADYYQKGELLNCPALFGRQAKDQIAQAMTHFTTVKRIRIPVFQAAIRADISLYEEVLKNMANSLNRMQDRLLRMATLHSRERIIHFLIHHIESAGRKVGYEYVLQPAMTHQEIGSIAGVSRQTVSTVLNDLRRKKIIHFTRSYLIIRDMEALRTLVTK